MADHIDRILREFEQNSRATAPQTIFTLPEYLALLNDRPERLLRDIFTLVHDMVRHYVVETPREDPQRPDALTSRHYDFHRLFVKGSDNPYFADPLFSRRFMELIDSFNTVPDWHKIYFFEGPPGSGKSTFLKNFLYRFERYMQTDQGEYYETLWRIDRARLVEADQPSLFTDLFDHNLFHGEADLKSRNSHTSRVSPEQGGPGDGHAQHPPGGGRKTSPERKNRDREDSLDPYDPYGV